MENISQEYICLLRKYYQVEFPGVAVGVKGYVKQYDLPFNQKNLKSLYDMRPSPEPSSVSLSIMRVGYDGNRIDWPYQIEKYEDFANRPFEELWEYVSTPKYKLDRSIRDNLEGSHIK
jgi:hypothetical protein